MADIPSREDTSGPGRPALTPPQLKERGWSKNLRKEALPEPDSRDEQGQPLFFLDRIEAIEAEPQISARIQETLKQRNPTPRRTSHQKRLQWLANRQARRDAGEDLPYNKQERDGDSRYRNISYREEAVLILCHPLGHILARDPDQNESATTPARYITQTGADIRRWYNHYHSWRETIGIPMQGEYADYQPTTSPGTKLIRAAKELGYRTALNDGPGIQAALRDLLDASRQNAIRFPDAVSDLRMTRTLNAVRRRTDPGVIRRAKAYRSAVLQARLTSLCPSPQSETAASDLLEEAVKFHRNGPRRWPSWGFPAVYFPS